MTTNETLERPSSLTPEIIRAELTVALSKEGLAYQQLLQDSENVVFSKDNINEERSALVNLRKVKKKLSDAENPYTERWAAWNSARKSLVDPVVSVLTKKEAEYRKIANEILAEQQKAELEKQRKAGILSEIDNFFITQSQAIAAATEPSELVRIEKLIGSNRANVSRYAEFLPLLSQKASNLTELIKEQKEAIRKLQALKSAENAANAKGDDQAVLDSREAQEQITAQIEQKRVTVQEVSISMAVQNDITEVEVIAPAAPKPRRQVWTWEVVDINLLAKKAAGWLILTPDTKKIDEFLKKTKEDGIEGEEFYLHGIRFFLEKSY